MKKWLLLLMTSFSITASANDSYSEEGYLKKIDEKIKEIEALIDLAERVQSKNSPIVFIYDHLRDDFKKIQIGINKKLHSKEVRLRLVPPLLGRYSS